MLNIHVAIDQCFVRLRKTARKKIAVRDAVLADLTNISVLKWAEKQTKKLRRKCNVLVIFHYRNSILDFYRNLCLFQSKVHGFSSLLFWGQKFLITRIKFYLSVLSTLSINYEPTSLRSLMTSFSRHLKKNNYSSSLMNNAVFDKARKVLRSKQKQLNFFWMWNSHSHPITAQWLTENR